jgi:hypothetical protein
MGEMLGISAVAVGNILERLGYRFDKRVTDSAVAAGCGVRRWDGYVLHYDWHLDRVVSAIRSAAEEPDKPAVADAFAEAIAKQHSRERVAAAGVNRRKRKTCVGKKRRPLYPCYGLSCGSFAPPTLV